MNKVDLNIENYNLNEILELFKLDYNFDRDDLKKAKRVVLMTHPDKSKMPKEYFLFYSKAYKMLYYIYDFRNKEAKGKSANTNYQQYTSEEDEIEHKKLIQNMNKKEEFHGWFNRLFEKHYDRNVFEQEGYGDWFKSEENMYNKDNKNFSQMSNNLDNIKQQQKSLSLVKKINIEQDVGHNMNSSNIYSDGIQNYSSGMNMENNSSVQYNDLKQAFQETLIPVTSEDYNNVKKYNSINEMQIHRKQSSVKPLTEKESYDILRQRESNNNEISNKAAFNLLEQARKNNEQNAMFWGSLKLLGNK